MDKQKRLSPAAAHFESIARSRPKDHHADLMATLPQHAGRLLDAGCASGRLTLQFARRVDFAVGIDLSYDLIELAREFEQAQGITNVAWVVGDIEHLPFQSHSFDLVVSTNAVRLTHLPIALEQLGRLVNPGGRLAIQDFVAERNQRTWRWLSSVIKTFKSVPRYLRFNGPLMTLRILAFRLSATELRRSAQVQQLTLAALEEIYHRAIPGSTLQTDRLGYLAIWDKPLAK